MIDITDKSRMPGLDEITAYIGNPLFDKICAHLRASYRAAHTVMYSGDKQLQGWNVRFSKSGKTLCRLYPQRGCFKVLVVVGPKEKARAESLLPELSEDMRAIWRASPEGMGQRWLMIDLTSDDALCRDTLALVALRAQRYVVESVQPQSP